jgi:hypothetical protein
MQPLEKLRMMEKIVRELDDLQNSQTSVLKKISQVEADNINLGNAELENKLARIFEDINSNLELVKDLHSSFSQETEEFKNNNKLEETPDLEST